MAGNWDEQEVREAYAEIQTDGGSKEDHEILAQALARLFASGAMKAFVLRDGFSQDEAADLLGTTYLRLTTPGEHRVEVSFTSLARTTVGFARLDEMRGKRRQSREEELTEEVGDALGEVDPEKYPDQQAIRSEWRTFLWRAIWNLPEASRCVILLAYFEGLSHREIAQRMGTHIGQSRTLLHRALRSLRAALRKIA